MEVVMCLVIMGMLFSGILLGYVTSAKRTEWSGYSLAAQALAIQQLEQARSAKWDVLSVPAVNEITNIPTKTATIMDIPYAGTNYTWATNYVTISPITLSTNPPVSVYLVRVDTVWRTRGLNFTNSIANYFAPDR
jgi:hypothetical protein